MVRRRRFLELGGATLGYLLVYRICEIASPSNCDTATVTLDLSGS